MAATRLTSVPVRDKAPRARVRTRLWSLPDLGGCELMRGEFIHHRLESHAHEGLVLSVIQAGGYRSSTRSRTLTAGPGSIVCYEPEQAFDCSANDSDGWSVSVFYPGAALLERAGAEPWLARRAGTREVIHAPALARDLLHLHRTLREETAQIERETLALGVLRRFARAYLVRRRADRDAPAPRHVALVRDHIQANFDRNVRLCDLEALTGLSSGYIVRSFARQIGMPPHHYLKMIRVRHARRMISQGMPLSEAAQACGFTDQSHMTRNFRAILGTPPGVIRGMVKNVQDSTAR